MYAKARSGLSRSRPSRQTLARARSQVQPSARIRPTSSSRFTASSISLRCGRRVPDRGRPIAARSAIDALAYGTGTTVTHDCSAVRMARDGAVVRSWVQCSSRKARALRRGRRRAAPMVSSAVVARPRGGREGGEPRFGVVEAGAAGERVAGAGDGAGEVERAPGDGADGRGGGACQASAPPVRTRSAGSLAVVVEVGVDDQSSGSGRRGRLRRWRG